MNILDKFLAEYEDPSQVFSSSHEEKDKLNNLLSEYDIASCDA